MIDDGRFTSWAYCAPQGEQAQHILDSAGEPETCEECDELLEDCTCSDDEEEQV